MKYGKAGKRSPPPLELGVLGVILTLLFFAAGAGFSARAQTLNAVEPLISHASRLMVFCHTPMTRPLEPAA